MRMVATLVDVHLALLSVKMEHDVKSKNQVRSKVSAT